MTLLDDVIDNKGKDFKKNKTIDINSIDKDIEIVMSCAEKGLWHKKEEKDSIAILQNGMGKRKETLEYIKDIEKRFKHITVYNKSLRPILKKLYHMLIKK